ncbi:DUF4349 domain-containing protein [Mobilitalea sibirica]|uniref:DUF4349 domain-containing protein n=1 Tax=Mobilitalea sibirica TaxID=1462919 RepID=A0A8J7KSQ9_9FIRM|nr:DUF4349 domain-containing protein [Mobilitalea sibirica]MBH1940551.1 DUF4349 domain-containing protein [Mobilitalea sibirica]
MNMKMKRSIKLLTIVVVLIMTMSACGAKSDSSEYKYSENESTEYDSSATEPQEAKGEMADDEYYDYAMDGNEAGLTSTSVFTTGNSGAMSMEKIIRRVNMDVETQEFDTLVNTIDEEINRLGGYVESSNLSGKRYYSRNVSRRGHIVARIPKNRLDEFVDIVYDNANVVNKAVDTENVTLEYVDAQSRKKALEIEQERLFALLEKTDTLDKIITLESRLSSIRYELQNYETQLRTIDNKVDYSTVTMSIEEVERMTPVEEEKLTVWKRIGTGFRETTYNISEGFQNFFVWFVVNLPYLIIWAIIITVIILIGRRIYKKTMKEYHPQVKQDRDGNSDNNKEDRIDENK